MDKMKEIVEKLNLWAYQYYTLDEPSVSDAEYDKLYDELLKLENAKKTERFMGVYTYFDTKFWIMSDYDCTIDTLVITVLLPEEY